MNGEHKHEYDPVENTCNINENIAQDWNNITEINNITNNITNL